MKWFRKSDWLPLSNAKAQVEFWEKDLRYAIEYLDYVKTFEGKGLPRYQKHLDLAWKDVEISKNGLKKAKEKLEETIKRDL